MSVGPKSHHTSLTLSPYLTLTLEPHLSVKTLLTSEPQHYKQSQEDPSMHCKHKTVAQNHFIKLQFIMSEYGKLLELGVEESIMDWIRC